jgi:exosortase sorting signal-containing protein
MNIRIRCLGALALMSVWPARAFVTTNVIANGSFESGLTGWTSATQLQSGASGTCGYNGATAPGTETITMTAGFPATSGTQIALGSVASTSGVNAIISCVLYQDVAIPAGATTATFTFDIGVKDGNDGGVFTAAEVGVYTTAAIPSFSSATLVGNAAPYFPAVADSTLQSQSSTVNFNISSQAGKTVRFAIINAANFMGHEVIGIDNVQFQVNFATPVVTQSVPTLSEWSLVGLALLLGLTGYGVLRWRTS